MIKLVLETVNLLFRLPVLLIRKFAKCIANFMRFIAKLNRSVHNHLLEIAIIITIIITNHSYIKKGRSAPCHPASAPARTFGAPPPALGKSHYWIMFSFRVKPTKVWISSASDFSPRRMVRIFSYDTLLNEWNILMVQATIVKIKPNHDCVIDKKKAKALLSPYYEEQ